ncbi:amidase signature domain-containing protein [Immersiella caudata]|uniref:amidase n=1 Tax=Immersiella caudata TaxID=314043 RepID=A0AA39X4S7_9PEZI|nr:amidase signature domain-containing protein [Immersiella caudata]
MPPKKRARLKKTWQEIARKAQDHRDASLNGQLNGADEALEELEHAKQRSSNAITITHNLPNLISREVLEITGIHPCRLSTFLSAGYRKTEDVMSAFCQMAAVAQKSVNCLTELLSSRAMVRAVELDKQFAITGRPVGPLHGIPVSVKSHIGVQGCQMAAGYVAWWDSREHRASKDALVVQILERAGAIVHARTTEPQSMMQLECVSNLYGTTVNPHNTNLSSGGSSGGEAALLAMRGSVIGVGSDVGGSIRVPAAACGIYGLKPTAFRVPTTGWSSTPPGADPIPTVIGPMSICLDKIEDFMKTVLAAEPWKVEPALIPLPWRDVEINPTPEQPLRIGVALHDNVVLPHPPILEAMQKFIDKIGALPNVEVVKFPLYKFDEAWAIASSLYFTDGGAADRKVMEESEEPMLPLVRWMLEENPGVKNLTREELEYWLEEREEYRLEYAERWNQTGFWDEAEGQWSNTVDALICPVAPGVASIHNTAKYWAYSAVWNLLDYPALAFPLRNVDKNRDLVEHRDDFLSPQDQAHWELYDPEVFHGVPVGLQIVGRRLEDEKIVAILNHFRSHECLLVVPQFYEHEEGTPSS